MESYKKNLSLLHEIWYNDACVVFRPSLMNEDKDKFTINVRRCGKCLENVRFVEKVRFPGTMYPTLTGTREGSGMRTFRPSELAKTVL